VPEWAAFVGLTGVVLLFVLALSRASQGLVRGGDADGSRVRIGEDPTLPDPGESDGRPRVGNDGREEPRPLDGSDDGGPEPDGTAPSSDPGSPATADASGDRVPPAVHTLEARTGPAPSTAGLLLNVTVTQLAFGSLLALGAWLSAVPAGVLGLSGAWIDAAGLGVVLGAGLTLTNEVGSAVTDRLGVGGEETLRELLAPDSTGEWVLLLVVVLPVIAGVEELLFRAALVGAVPAAYAVPAWAMVAVSSVAFGLAHGAQGPGGVAVAAGLGVVLGAAFLVTGSLVTVVVAHYLVNALEFAIHEGVG